MRVGYQTISWGGRIDDGGEAMLGAISEAGYDGVEIAQHPEEFGSATALYGLLRDRNLKLLGLAGGLVSQRIAFLEELVDAENRDLLTRKGKLDKVIGFDDEHPYIYTDMWDSSFSTGIMDGRWKLALHPHMFKPIQTASEALEMLKKHPRLRFLPDTAHLTIAGEDVVRVLEEAFAIPILDEETGECIARKFGPVTAVHLKDWTSQFGRSYQFYSRGFGIRFGEGEVKLDRIVRFLIDRGYDGWVVVEQDVVDNLVGAVHACRRWLQGRNI